MIWACRLICSLPVLLVLFCSSASIISVLERLAWTFCSNGFDKFLLPVLSLLAFLSHHHHHIDENEWNEHLAFCAKLIDFCLASTPIIEVTEDNSEPLDEADMSFLNEVLEQYQQSLHHQGLRTRMHLNFVSISNPCSFHRHCLHPWKYVLSSYLDHLESQPPVDQPTTTTATDAHKDGMYPGAAIPLTFCMRILRAVG